MRNTAYTTRLHRDRPVTVWDVYHQQWVRTARPADRVLAALSAEERARILSHIGDPRANNDR
jgi:hypothetical protein